MERPRSEDSSPLSDAIAELISAYVERPEGAHTDAVARVLAAFPGREDEVRARLRALRALGIELEQVPGGGVPERLGDFRLIRPLGEGGMGVVYLAEQVSLGREVALKLVRPELLFFPRARERFAREVEAVSRLQHPGIVPVHAVGEAEGVPYYAMERFRGCTLNEVLDELAGRAPESVAGAEVGAFVAASPGGGELEAGGRELYSGPWAQVALRIAAQLAEALHHAHGRGIVHRDLKPSNVALTVDGRAVLLDFGLTSSESDERITRTGSALGTLHYMAPEQIGARGEIGPRTDVYGLGATLYEMLTFQLPHVGADRAATERRILIGEPDPPRARNREIPVDAETVCLHAIDRDPARRYATTADFARDLDNVLTHRPIEARPPGSVVRARRLVERNPSRALAVLLALGLVTLLPSALLIQQVVNNRAIRESRDELAETLVLRDRALESALYSEAVQEQMLVFLNGLFGAVDPDLALGREPSLRAILDAGAARVGDEFSDQPEAQAMMRRSIGRVYTSLGDYDRAIELLEPAAELFRRSIESGASRRLSLEEGEDIRWLASILEDLGMALTRRQSYERAEAVLREALALAIEIDDQPRRARQLSSLGTVFTEMEQLEEGVSYFERALEVYATLADADPILVSTARLNLALSLAKLGREDEADAMFKDGLGLLRDELDARHPALAKGLNLYSQFLKLSGRPAESREALEEAADIMRAVLPADSDALGIVIYNLARVRDDSGDLEGALELYVEAREVLSGRPPDHFTRLLNEANYANALRRTGRPGEAVAIYQAVLPLFEERWPDGHPFLVNVHQSWAWSLRDLGLEDGAREHERAIEEIQAKLAPDR